MPAPPEADLLGFSHCVVTVIQCNKFYQIRWLEIICIKLTVLWVRNLGWALLGGSLGLSWAHISGGGLALADLT